MFLRICFILKVQPLIFLTRNTLQKPLKCLRLTSLAMLKMMTSQLCQPLTTNQFRHVEQLSLTFQFYILENKGSLSKLVTTLSKKKSLCSLKFYDNTVPRLVKKEEDSFWNILFGNVRLLHEIQHIPRLHFWVQKNLLKKLKVVTQADIRCLLGAL